MSEDNLGNEAAGEDVNSEAASSPEAVGGGTGSSAETGESAQSAESAQSVESPDELIDPLSEAMKTITSLEEQLARARADLDVHERGVGADDRTLADAGGALQDHARVEEDVGCEVDVDVDPRGVGVDHADPL